MPLLFWCGDYRFARHMTYVVCFGLVWGNLLKDVFRLPRPRNVKQEVRDEGAIGSSVFELSKVAVESRIIYSSL